MNGTIPIGGIIQYQGYKELAKMGGTVVTTGLLYYIVSPETTVQKIATVVTGLFANYLLLTFSNTDCLKSCLRAIFSDKTDNFQIVKSQMVNSETTLLDALLERIEAESEFSCYTKTWTKQDFEIHLEANWDNLSEGQLSEILSILKQNPSFSLKKIVKTKFNPENVCFKQLVSIIAKGMAKCNESSSSEMSTFSVNSDEDTDEESDQNFGFQFLENTSNDLDQTIEDPIYDDLAEEENYSEGIKKAESILGYESTCWQSGSTILLNHGLFQRLLDQGLFSVKIKPNDTHAIGFYYVNQSYYIYDPRPNGYLHEFKDLKTCINFLKSHIESNYSKDRQVQLYKMIA